MIDLLPILSLYRVHNPGIAFSFLADFGGLPLIVITVAITVVVLVFWRTAKDGGRWATVGYALIIGGALGNLVDRILHGHVVDFLLLHIGDRTLFVFNLADAALTARSGDPDPRLPVAAEGRRRRRSRLRANWAYLGAIGVSVADQSAPATVPEQVLLDVRHRGRRRGPCRSR